MKQRNAVVSETTYRKRRKGIVYRMMILTYEDGSGEKFLIPPVKLKDKLICQKKD